MLQGSLIYQIDLNLAKMQVGGFSFTDLLWVLFSTYLICFNFAQAHTSEMNFSLTYIGSELHIGLLDSIKALEVHSYKNNDGLTCALIRVSSSDFDLVNNAVAQWKSEDNNLKFKPVPHHELSAQVQAHIVTDEHIFENIRAEYKRGQAGEASTYHFWSRPHDFPLIAEGMSRTSTFSEIEACMEGPF